MEKGMEAFMEVSEVWSLCVELKKLGICILKIIPDSGMCPGIWEGGISIKYYAV